MKMKKNSIFSYAVVRARLKELVRKCNDSELAVLDYYVDKEIKRRNTEECKEIL